jgi:hypothetical protein
MSYITPRTPSFVLNSQISSDLVLILIPEPFHAGRAPRPPRPSPPSDDSLPPTVRHQSLFGAAMVSDWFVVACRSFFSRGANLTALILLSLQQATGLTTRQSNKGVEREGEESSSSSTLQQRFPPSTTTTTTTTTTKAFINAAKLLGRYDKGKYHFFKRLDGTKRYYRTGQPSSLFGGGRKKKATSTKNGHTYRHLQGPYAYNYGFPNSASTDRRTI